MKNINEENNENVFDSKQPIYSFQKNAFVPAIIIGFFWFALTLIMKLDESVDNFIIYTMMSPSIIIFIIAFSSMIKQKKYKKLSLYVKEKGHKINGKVKEIIKFEIYDKNYLYGKRIDRYLSIEFNDEVIGISGIYVTPRLYQIPKKESINCDVYILLEDLPNKYKKFKYEDMSHPYQEYCNNNIIVDNFR